MNPEHSEQLLRDGQASLRESSAMDLLSQPYVHFTIYDDNGETRFCASISNSRGDCMVDGTGLTLLDAALSLFDSIRRPYGK